MQNTISKTAGALVAAGALLLTGCAPSTPTDSATTATPAAEATVPEATAETPAAQATPSAADTTSPAADSLAEKAAAAAQGTLDTFTAEASTYSGEGAVDFRRDVEHLKTSFATWLDEVKKDPSSAAAGWGVPEAAAKKVNDFIHNAGNAMPQRIVDGWASVKQGLDKISAVL